MLQLLRRLRDGGATRADVHDWTRAVHSQGPDTLFRGNATACWVFDSIWNIESTSAGRYLVDSLEIATYVRWLEEGDAERVVELVSLKFDIPALEERVGLPAVRVYIDGWAWTEWLRFGSAATGRGFLARAPLRGSVEGAVAVIAAPEWGVPADVLADLLETLAIDLEDVEIFHRSIATDELPRWQLWRQDDNGARYPLRVFSSRSKAMAVAGSFADLGHKQVYWVQQAEIPATAGLSV